MSPAQRRAFFDLDRWDDEGGSPEITETPR
jgi:hypothetical protein